MVASAPICRQQDAAALTISWLYCLNPHWNWARDRKPCVLTMAVHFDWAQGAPAITLLTGRCTATVAGTEIGCDGKAAVSKLPNGRVLINFMGTDVATIGFVGAHLQLLGSEQVLWLDGGYINQERIAAETGKRHQR